MSFRQELLRRAARTPVRLLLPEAADPRVRQAAERLGKERIVEPVLVGPGGLEPGKDPRLPRVAQLLRDRRPDRVEDAVHALDLASDPLRFSAAMVALGEADGCVAGAAHTTADVLRAALWAIGPAEGTETISSAFYVIAPGHDVLTFTDCAVVPEPSSEQLAQIALAAAKDRTSLVGDTPRVAFLSYSTKGSAAGPRVQRIRDAVERFHQLAPDIAADGELQVDAALDPTVAQRKGAADGLGGRANILVFPDLDSGNIGYKLVRTMGAVTLGPLLQGLARPMSDLSRAASADDIVEVAAMVALQGAAR